MTERNMQVHRFRQLVGFSAANGGPTLYLSPAEAIALAKALRKAGREIAAGVPFGQSIVGTVLIPVDAMHLSAYRSDSDKLKAT